MENEFKDMFIKQAKKINVNIDNANLEKFYIYMNLLLEWNKKINLTAIVEEKEVIQKHFIDSLTILKYIKDNTTVIDVGTGAGFPGIPIAIQNKTNEVTLLDSLNKRILFLEDVKEKIGLENVKCVHERAEDVGHDNRNREKFDFAVSRAVANLSTLVEYLLPLVKVGGKCICMKGPAADKEVEEARFAIETLGGKIEKIENLVLPDSDIERNIIIIEKVKRTPNIFPRKAGIPSKEPIKDLKKM